MIPLKKVEIAKKEVKEKCIDCKDKNTICYNCKMWNNFIDQMYISEIPVDYWFRDMKNFYGDARLNNFFDNLDIDQMYKKGNIYYLAGERGRGKTLFACSVLKNVIIKRYTSFYINLTDYINRVIKNEIDIKDIDFIVIDEVDNRFFPTIPSMELYGSLLESLLRGRVQNNLPTIIISNAIEISSVFSGQYKKSFESLFSQFAELLIISGPDARKNNEKRNDG